MGEYDAIGGCGLNCCQGGGVDGARDLKYSSLCAYRSV